MKQIQKFIIGRVKSLKYAIKGFYLLIKTEDAIITHLFTFGIFTLLGFYFNLSQTQWLFQLLAFGGLFVTEGLNTAIEKLCDFIHPDFHKKIGEIKDVSAGAVTFAWFFAAMVLLLIYGTMFL